MILTKGWISILYIDKKPINLKDFEKDKIFKHYSTFPSFIEFDDFTIPDVDASHMGFTITKLDECNFEHDMLGGCGQCKLKYGCGFWFAGLAYNTGLNEDDPVEYEGYIKTYPFFRCDCKCDCDEFLCCNTEDIDDNGKVTYDNNVPYVEITCAPTDNKYNVVFLRNTSVFNVKYCPLSK